MAPKVARIRPKRHSDVADAAQLVLGLPSLDDMTRRAIHNAVEVFQPSEPWLFTMISTQQMRAVVKAIGDGPRPLDTLKVWNVALTYVERNTGEIMASGKQMAADAGIGSKEVSKALTRLCEIGAVQRIKAGKYTVNPHCAWNGQADARESKAQHIEPVQAPLPFSVIDGGKI
ncbi:hypothetical protein FZ983_33245 [Azospirillum sp. B21]|uniref:replication/maintenance protein RepL n=1 Tax=Azospirillum sp. B21 TaxID=2607496 RepID=UPI0011ECBDC0|nr:replication/maintenance protein RepL [Azospirillum sp. B21]KAA0571574.1 hypothetical protein FZ983_33245 [Azospirillum sp. B21]